jgi:asparagine synthetase B (glutamine-hydrolysing)
LIHSLARREGRRVFLSGQGGDEILDARRHWPGYLFPDKLRQWPDFSGGFQTAYLTKEEFVAGALGTEGRFPYLDRNMVQEFLWLSPELKNRNYKAPLHEYMTRCGYPFDEGVKTGFCPLPGNDKLFPWAKVASD